MLVVRVLAMAPPLLILLGRQAMPGVMAQIRVSFQVWHQELTRSQSLVQMVAQASRPQLSVRRQILQIQRFLVLQISLLAMRLAVVECL